jgi:hypothetical protein
MKNTETKKELSTRYPQRANRFISITRVGTKEIQKVNILRNNEILSEYQVQFKAKQSIKKFYGNLSEKSFQQISKKTSNKLILLEKRLDVLIFRLGFARSILEARALIKGGLVKIDNTNVSPKSHNKIVYIGSKISVFNTDIAYLAKFKQLKFNLEPLPTHLFIPSFPTETIDIKVNQLEGYIIKEPIESELYLPYRFPINKI